MRRNAFCMLCLSFKFRSFRYLALSSGIQLIRLCREKSGKSGDYSPVSVSPCNSILCALPDSPHMSPDAFFRNVCDFQKLPCRGCMDTTTCDDICVSNMNKLDSA